VMLSFIMSVRLSTRNNSAPTGQIFTKFDTWVFFSKICPENWIFIKIWQVWQLLCMKTNVHFGSYLTQFFFRMRNVSDKRWRENKNTHFIS
jgi:hypothetical protein